MKRVSSRSHPLHSLLGELRALANRSLCADVLVLDASALRVWASSSGDGLLMATVATPALRLAIEELRVTQNELLEALRDEPLPPSIPPPAGSDPPVRAWSESLDEATDTSEEEDETPSVVPIVADDVDADRSALRERAREHLRSNAPLDSVRRGKPVHVSHATGSLGYVARSFGRLYLLVLVFEGDFDRSRAEAALRQSLPRVQSSVSAIAAHILS